MDSMSVLHFFIVKLRNVATFTIASCFALSLAMAQGNSPADSAVASVLVMRGKERQTIEQERAKARGAFEASKEVCYQKFAVNNCIEKARLQQREVLADLKRREVVLNDLERKNLAIAQQQSTDTKTSPQRQAEIAAQRGNALADTTQRQARNQQKAAERAAKLGRPPLPNGPPKQLKNPQPVKPVPTPKARVDIAAAKARYEQRIKEASKHRATVLARMQSKQSKPAAASLPVPSN